MQICILEFDDNIYPTDVDASTLVTPPNVDSDERIIILILDIQDGWSGSTGEAMWLDISTQLNETQMRPDLEE